VAISKTGQSMILPAEIRFSQEFKGCDGCDMHLIIKLYMVMGIEDIIFTFIAVVLQ
jgi:hypothetical protein